jgi:outer membrane protein assembly factor BamA
MWVFVLAVIVVFGDLSLSEAVLATRIQVEGRRWTRSWVIDRELAISPGDTIRPEALEETRNHLLNLKLFTRVEVTADSAGVVTINLTEAWHIWPLVDLSLDDTQISELFESPRRFFEGSSIDLGLVEMNFAGTGASLFGLVRMGASTGGAITYQTRWLSRGLPLAVRAHYRNLLMADRHAAIQGIEQKLHNVRVETQVGTREGARSRIALRLRYDQVKQEPLYIGTTAPHDKVGLVGIILAIDRRDLEWYPSNGSFVQLQADYTGGDRHYCRSQADARAFWPLYDGRRPIVLALRMRGATASAGMPPWARWFFGFDTGFRGYRTSESEVDGYLSGTVEIRFPLTEIVYMDLPIGGVFRNLPLGLNGVLFAERTELRLGRRRWELLAGGVGLACRVPYFEIVELDLTFPAEGDYEIGASLGMTF